MVNIRRITKNEINLDRIYKSKFDAINMSNAFKANRSYWKDNLILEYNEGSNVGIIYQDSIAIAYINIKELVPMDKYYNLLEEVNIETHDEELHLDELIKQR